MDSSNQKIPVEKVTKPIQLLAAWLTGLIVIDASFLVAATALENPLWAKGALVIAAIVNVPLFLISIFLLQTKFRPEMQEDSFYSKYLESKTGTTPQPVSNNQLAKLKEEVFTANTETIQLLASVQDEIKHLRGDVKKDVAENSELDVRIKEAVEASSWNQFQIKLNNLISDKDAFKKALIQNNIPIHGMFGYDKSYLTDPPYIVIGPGFDVPHLKKILNSISNFTVSSVAFAYPEEDTEDADYHKTILIGAYHEHNYGLSLKDAVELINSPGIEINSFYSALKC